MTGLTDDQRVSLYGSMLRGIGKACQDRLCREDRSSNDHDWGMVRWYPVYPDLGPPRVRGSDEPVQFIDVKLTRYGITHCQNCGKEERVNP